MNRIVSRVVLLLFLFCPAGAVAFAQRSATVGGVVRDLHGAPQMGALVELLRADTSVVAQTFTDDHGRYLLSSVTPGSYQLRASAAFLMPALRSNLRLNAGVSAMANLTMAALFEVGEWFPATRRSPDESSDDWRWTLRSTANRPILRLAGEDGADADGVLQPALSSETQPPSIPSFHEHFAVLMHGAEFAEGGTHQEFSAKQARDGGVSEMIAADVGEPGSSAGKTSIALMAGYDQHTTPGGETHVVASLQSHPEISGPGVNGLQAVTLATSEHFALGDAVMIDAGTLLSAERLVKSRAKASPFLRVVVTPAPGIALMYRLSSDRSVQTSAEEEELHLPSDVLSDVAGQPIEARPTHQEIAATRFNAHESETISVYQDELPVEALQGIGRLNTSDLHGLPVLADATSGTFRLAMGGYTARGVSVAWTHTVGPELAACLKADLGSSLLRREDSLVLNDLDAGVRPGVAPALSAALEGKIVRSGTSFWTQYRWQPSSTLDAVNAFNTVPDQAYLGLLLKQKLWSGHRLQGMDAVIAATNLLEEGYQPVVGSDGRTLFLTQAARTLQAGLSFSF